MTTLSFQPKIHTHCLHRAFRSIAANHDHEYIRRQAPAVPIGVYISERFWASSLTPPRPLAVTCPAGIVIAGRRMYARPSSDDLLTWVPPFASQTHRARSFPNSPPPTTGKLQCRARRVSAPATIARFNPLFAVAFRSFLPSHPAPPRPAPPRYCCLSLLDCTVFVPVVFGVVCDVPVRRQWTTAWSGCWVRGMNRRVRIRVHSPWCFSRGTTRPGCRTP